MHPILAKFPNQEFYHGNLQNGVSETQRFDPRTDSIFQNRAGPLIFHNIEQPEEINVTGFGFLNTKESDLVCQYVNKLIDAGVNGKEIGVVTPYEGQRTYISNKLQAHDVEVANIDAFQGREINYVIISCVRSNKFGDIGFLIDEKRLNVRVLIPRYLRMLLT